MSGNDASRNVQDLSNAYKSAFTSALLEVMFCNGKVEVLNIVDDNMNEDLSELLEDDMIYEEINILSSGIQRGEKSFSFEYTSQKDGRSFVVKAVYTQMLYESQYPVFRLHVYDVTMLKREIDKERLNNYEFEQISEYLSLSVIKIGLEEGNPVHWYNSSFIKNFGSIPIDAQSNRKRFIELVALDDRQDFLELIERSLNDGNVQTGRITIFNDESYSQVYEVKIVPSVQRQIKQNAVYCVLSVLTEEMRREQELKSFEERYKMVLSFTSEVIFEYDLESDTIRYFGGEASTMKRPAYIKDFYKKVLINSLPFGKLTEESREEISRLLTMIKDKKMELIDSYICYQHNITKAQWIYVVGKCIFSKQNEPMLIVGKLADVTVHKEVERELMTKAYTDSLTQVSNREYAQEQIQMYLRNNNPDLYSALLIIDVDNFKSVNDYYGHLKGDTVLIKLGEILRNEFRSSDIVGRLGGDEFIVFMKDVASISTIYKKAEIICQTVREILKSVTVSVGISINTDNKYFHNLYKTADVALYQAKVRGKNTYVCYNDLDEDLKKLDEISEWDAKDMDMIDITGNGDFSSHVFSNFGKTILESYDFIFAVNLTQDKMRRFDEEKHPGSEHNFRSYSDMFDHVHKEIFDSEEQKDFEKYFSKDTLMDTFLGGEKYVHRYIRIFNVNQEFHWYFMEAVLHETTQQGDVICTLLFKDVQKSRSDEMRKYENKTKSHMIKKLENEKSYDSLTGTYQPNKFYEVAKSIIWSNMSKKYAIISFDIDNFRVINDIYSVETGDQIICYMADVLSKLEIEDKVYCRYYAECFTLLISYESRKDIVEIIDCIREECAKTAYISTTFKMSFGVYLVTDPSIPIRLMCDWARLATRPIKGLSNQYYAFYNEEYRKELVETQRIEAEMHHALENDEFKMYLQPKYNLRTNQVVGAEALVRWQHPEQGIIYPNRFIKLFEKNGFILQLDEYMWELACKELRKWIDMGIHYPISVNISRLHIYDPTLVQKLISLTNKYGVPVELLELEFTEGLFMENVHMLYGLMYDLKKQGFVLQMDDFGSGFSSLNMLKSVPIDVIKLDKAFFEDINENARGKIIIEDSIRMIHNLDLEVMAEGIETQEHVDFLNQCNCIIGQGYYYAKPMSIDDFDERLIQPALLNK